MILDAITSSPFNVLFTIALGIGLVYLYYRKPSTSSSSSTTSSAAELHSSRVFVATTTRGPNNVGVIDDDLQRAIAQIERQERDMIRQEQDAAYQQSLKADREKQLKRELELKKKEAEEKAELERIASLEDLHNRLIKLKSEIKDKLPKESKTSHDQEEGVKLQFKLPDGTRVQRTFRRGDKVKYLHWYVFSLEKAPLQFKLTTNFPKRDLPGRPPVPSDFEDVEGKPVDPDMDATLEEANLTESQNIFVYDLEA